MIKKECFFYESNMGHKNAEFDADFEFVKKVAKKLMPKKLQKNGAFNFFLRELSAKVFGL
jgi:hypothetical protein